MKYDRKLLEEWCGMEDWGSYLIRQGGIGKYSSKEGLDFLQKKYFRILEMRIEQVKEMLKEHEDAFIHFVIGRLYTLRDLENEKYRGMSQAEYHALRSLEFNCNFALSKKLLDEIQDWKKFIKEVDEENF